jgi:hypothetical protein
MTDTPEQKPAHALDAPEEDVTTHVVSREPITVNSSSARWLAPLALAISLVAAGLGGWALAKTSSHDDAAAVGPVIHGDPKATVCAAFQQVATAVSLQTHTDLGQEPVPQLAVAGNARLALLGGGQFLLSRIPAGTPSELADTVRSFATNLEQIGMNYLAGVSDSDQGQTNLQADSQADSAKIVAMCK